MKTTLSEQRRHRGIAASLAALTVAALSCAVLADDSDLREQLRRLQERVEAQEAEMNRQRRIIQSLRTGASDPNGAEARRAEDVEAAVAVALDDPDLPEHTFTAGWDRGFKLRSADGNYGLTLGGWIQPRYEFRRRSAAEDTSTFTMRRIRLDIRGHVFTPDLTFRIMPELARTANLRDGWINYAFSPEAQVRFGQFTVPFQWHRDVGPRRQHFAERGVPSETFGFLNGRDVGVMLHGVLAENRLKYGVGFFDGAGRNVATSNSDGNMTSARLAYAVMGELPREESDLAFSEEMMLAVGGGLQGAWRNEVRDWDLGRSATGNSRADWMTATIDGRLAWRGLSLAGDLYYRWVDPQDDAVGSYEGWAYMLSAGYFIVPEKYEIVGRFSQLMLDDGDGDTRSLEWGVGFNVYYRGHDWKTRVNLLRSELEDEHDVLFLIEHHLQF